MKTDQQPDGDDKGKQPDNQPTPEQLAAQEKETADLLAKVGLTPDELDNARAYKTRKKEVDAGFAKRFQKANEELTDREKALEAERQKTAELNARIEAKLAELDGKSPAAAADAEAEFDSIVSKYRRKVENGDLTADEADAKIAADQKALLRSLHVPARKQEGKETTEETMRRVLKEYDTERRDGDVKARQKQAIDSIASKLGKQHNVSSRHAKAIYLSELDDSGDPVLALRATSKLLSKLTPAQPEREEETGGGPLKLKPRQGAENAGSAKDSNDKALEDALRASGIEPG